MVFFSLPSTQCPLVCWSDRPLYLCWPIPVISQMALQSFQSLNFFWLWNDCWASSSRMQGPSGSLNSQKSSPSLCRLLSSVAWAFPYSAAWFEIFEYTVLLTWMALKDFNSVIQKHVTFVRSACLQSLLQSHVVCIWGLFTGAGALEGRLLHGNRSSIYEGW